MPHFHAMIHYDAPRMLHWSHFGNNWLPAASFLLALARVRQTL